MCISFRSFLKVHISIMGRILFSHLWNHSWSEFWNENFVVVCLIKPSAIKWNQFKINRLYHNLSYFPYNWKNKCSRGHFASSYVAGWLLERYAMFGFGWLKFFQIHVRRSSGVWSIILCGLFAIFLCLRHLHGPFPLVKLMSISRDIRL